MDSCCKFIDIWCLKVHRCSVIGVHGVATLHGGSASSNGSSPWDVSVKPNATKFEALCMHVSISALLRGGVKISTSLGTSLSESFSSSFPLAAELKSSWAWGQVRVSGAPAGAVSTLRGSGEGINLPLRVSRIHCLNRDCKRLEVPWTSTMFVKRSLDSGSRNLSDYTIKMGCWGFFFYFALSHDSVLTLNLSGNSRFCF